VMQLFSSRRMLKRSCKLAWQLKPKYQHSKRDCIMKPLYITDLFIISCWLITFTYHCICVNMLMIMGFYTCFGEWFEMFNPSIWSSKFLWKYYEWIYWNFMKCEENFCGYNSHEPMTSYYASHTSYLKKK